jgi:hypothetical protein
MPKKNLEQLKLDNTELKKENFRLQKMIAKLNATLVSANNKNRAESKLKPHVSVRILLPKKQSIREVEN